MTHDEKIVEAVARAIEGEIDTIELVSASPETIRWLKAARIARAAITAFQAEAWQPIETHKTDAIKGPYSPHVLCAHSEHGWRRFGRYDLMLKRWYYSGTDERSQWAQVEGDEPTHWQHIPTLPPAPKATP